MKLKFIAAALATSAVAYAGAGFAALAPTIYNPDNPTGASFVNFDEASNGTAFTNGFAPVAGTNFTLTYFADVAQLTGGTASFAHIDGDASKPIAGSTYEYTVVATLNETVTSCDATGTVCMFHINGGNFNVYFDNKTATFADNTLGTGFSDGLLQLSGSIAASTADQTFSTVAGFNVTAVVGNISYTDMNPADPSYITPSLSTATTVSTLQLGMFQTAPPAGGYNGTAFTSSNVVFQADGNTAFTTAVPEPGSLALLGLGAAALGLRLRRRKSA